MTIKTFLKQFARPEIIVFVQRCISFFQPAGKSCCGEAKRKKQEKQRALLHRNQIYEKKPFSVAARILRKNEAGNANGFDYLRSMHFSHGQISFIIAFVTAFAVALIWAYRKDRTANKKNYSGVWKVLISLILIFAALSYILKNLRN